VPLGLPGLSVEVIASTVLSETKVILDKKDVGVQSSNLCYGSGSTGSTRFLGLPDPLVRGMDPDPSIMQKYQEKP
jgi:hypothetical protein